MLCTRCRTRTAVTDDGLCTFCSGTRPPLPGGLMAPVAGPGGGGSGPDSPVGLSRAVVALLAAGIAADLFSIGTGLHLRGLWNGYLADGDLGIHSADGDLAARLYSYSAYPQIYTLLATGILFILWFRRTRRNAEVFEAGVQRSGPGWAVGGWFVPIANFWIPYRVACDIWMASSPNSPDGGWRSAPRVPLNLWWGAWVASTVLYQVASRRWERADEAGAIVDAASLMVAADVLDIVAAVLAIVFVRTLTRMQVERAVQPWVPAPAVPGAHR